MAIELAPQPGVDVGIDVAGPQLRRRPARRAAVPAGSLPKSTITGTFGRRARFDRTLDRRPLGAGEVCRLDADDRCRGSRRRRSRRLHVHVAEVLLEGAAPHPVADDVEEGEDAGAGPRDDA